MTVISILRLSLEICNDEKFQSTYSQICVQLFNSFFFLDSQYIVRETAILVRMGNLSPPLPESNNSCYIDTVNVFLNHLKPWIINRC